MAFLHGRRENLVRAAYPGVEYRDVSEDDDDSIGVLSGHFSVFDSWYEVNSAWEGNFLERVSPGAFRKTFRENRDNIKVLYDHGRDPNIGGKPLGPLRELREDERGGYYEVPLLDTSYNRDLVPALRAGLLGASFRFKVVRDHWDEKPERSAYNPRGIPERTIKETQVMELGPVTFPASPSATAGVRSTTDEYIIQTFMEHPEQLRDLLLRALPPSADAEGDDVRPEADNTPEDSSPDSFRSETEETAPEAEAPTASAEPEAHPAPVRRTSVLFGLHTEEKPKWEL